MRDKTRSTRIPPLGPEVAARVVALTQGDPPGATTHWTAAAMSKVAAISVSSVQRMLERARSAAASGPVVQALHRSGLRRQVA